MAKKSRSKLGSANRASTKGAFGANRTVRMQRMREHPFLRALMDGQKQTAGKPLPEDEHS